MKKKLFLALLFILVLSINSSAQTQSEMNQTAINDYNKADVKLNIVYKKAIKNISEIEKKLLKTAQINWIKFRDSQCNFEAAEVQGGSLEMQLLNSCKTQKTLDRITDLNKIINREK